MPIYLDYIREMYYYLLSMTDDEIAEFYINDSRCRNRLFDAMKADFESYGPVSKQRVLDAIEFILFSRNLEDYWRAAVPHAVPLDEIEDKPGYLRELYKKLAGHEPPKRDFGEHIELVDAIAQGGIDVRQ